MRDGRSRQVKASDPCNGSLRNIGVRTMAYKEYNYGPYRTEIRKLMRKRLALLDKVRYHKNKAKKFESEDIPKIEEEINRLLKRAGGLQP
jgi:hypothetical protein